MPWTDLQAEIAETFGEFAEFLDRATTGGAPHRDDGAPVQRGHVLGISLEARIEVGLRRELRREWIQKWEMQREWDAVVSTPQGREITRISLGREMQRRYAERMQRLGREVPQGPHCSKNYCKAPLAKGADGKPLRLCEKHAEAARQAVRKSKAKAKQKGIPAVVVTAA